MLQKVVRSTVIDAPIERVWAVLRDFNSHDQWHDVVEASRIEGGERSDQVGCVRSFTLKDGNRIREQLLTLSDTEHKSTYCIVEATVPLQRYVATVTLKPVTDGNRTFWHWESTFATPPGMERELRDMVAQGVYEAGFANLRRHLQPRRRPARRRRRAAHADRGCAMPRAARRRPPLRRARGAAGRATARRRRPAPARCASASAPSASTSSTSTCAAAGCPACCRSPGVPGMEAAGTVLDVGAGRQRPAARRPRGLPRPACPAPTAACAACRADWVVRLPAAVEDDIAAALLLKGITADYLLRDLGRVRRRHAAAGARGGRRRRPAACAPGRAASAPR